MQCATNKRLGRAVNEGNLSRQILKDALSQAMGLVDVPANALA